ncbi:MAG: hypothetical protein V4596_11065 [Bdellovibrionota bacterium]
MNALFTKIFVVLGLIFSSSAYAEMDKPCVINIDVDGWKDLETVLFIAAGGYAMTHDSSKAEYKVQIDEVEGQVKRCLYGCDEKQDVLIIMSIMNAQGDVVFTKNKVATKYRSQDLMDVGRVSNDLPTKMNLLRAIPECKDLRALEKDV